MAEEAGNAGSPSRAVAANLGDPCGLWRQSQKSTRVQPAGAKSFRVAAPNELSSPLVERNIRALDLDGRLPHRCVNQL